MLTVDEIAAAVLKKIPAAVWGTDGTVPAARPPVNNADFFKADGKTPDNTSWSGGYGLQTAVEGIRKTQQALGAVAAQVAALSAVVTGMAAGGGLTAAEIQAAAEAGARAARAELGDKLQEH